MSNIGVKTSLKGYDVKSASQKNLSLSSSYNCLKIEGLQTTTITTDSSGVQSKSILHGKSFRPCYILAILFKGGYYFEPFDDHEGIGLRILAEVNQTNITVHLSALGDPNTTFNLYYWVSNSEEAI